MTSMTRQPLGIRSMAGRNAFLPVSPLIDQSNQRNNQATVIIAPASDTLETFDFLRFSLCREAESCSCSVPAQISFSRLSFPPRVCYLCVCVFYYALQLYTNICTLYC